MGSIKFIRENGGIKVPPANKDHVSGLIAYFPQANVPASFISEPVAKVGSLDELVALGLEPDASNDYAKLIHYHVYEFFRQNQNGELYVAIFPASETINFNELSKLQQFANGEIRQVGVYYPVRDLLAVDLSALQTKAAELSKAEMPLSVIYAANVTSVASLDNMSSDGLENVSVVIGEDVDVHSISAGLRSEIGKSITCIGAVLGMLSKAAVHQSIAWVGRFPLGLISPGFCDGSKLSDVPMSAQYGSGSLDEMRYIFPKTYVGRSGNYLNDSHNLTIMNSDYNSIERVRTMDKAIRGIRYELQPEINSNALIDSKTGQLPADTVGYYETVANRTLEAMAKSGELSGYRAVIDPLQNVLGTGEIEIQIRNVPSGVVRNFKVKIGFAQSV